MTDGPAPAAERRSRLLGIKLRTLVAEHLGLDGSTAPDAEIYPSGAALVHEGAAWVLIDGPADRSLGGALAWALRHGATSLELIADRDTGLLARRAERLGFPVDVWFPQDRVLLAAVSEPLAPPEPAPDAHLALIAVIEAAGADPNVEHGAVFGEVRGLEVCRVVDQPTIGHFVDVSEVDLAAFEFGTVDGFDGVQLEVGVGVNDREAFRLLHGDIPTIEALATVVESVSSVRTSDAPQHPLNRLGQERYLRWQIECEPGLVGVVRVEPTQPPLPRPNLKDAMPCVALGIAGDGRRYAIVCSVGVDVDLVGFVADVQAMTADPIIVALRERDLVPITRDLLGLLSTPVEIRTV
jgi:nucleotide-binding universal stress UspA family protein